MFPKPVTNLRPNTFEYEEAPLIKSTGFREYDARWLFGAELNLMGVQALGTGLGAPQRAKRSTIQPIMDRCSRCACRSFADSQATRRLRAVERP